MNQDLKLTCLRVLRDPSAALQDAGIYDEWLKKNMCSVSELIMRTTGIGMDQANRVLSLFQQDGFIQQGSGIHAMMTATGPLRNHLTAVGQAYLNEHKAG